MESLRTTLDQIKLRFAQMTPTARIAAAALGALVLVGLLLFVRGSTHPRREYLFGGREFSQSDLAAMEQAFGEAGLNDWQIEGYRVEVPSSHKAEYLAAIGESNAVSLDFESPVHRALSQSGFLESPDTRRTRAKTARQQKMAMVVKRLPGIKDAAVEYNETETQTFPRRTERQALVAVEAVGKRHLAMGEVDAIRRAIASTQGGLDSADVAVLDINATRTYSLESDLSDPMAGAHQYAAQKQTYEMLWKQKIQQRLIHYPGLVVEVNVELTPRSASLASHVPTASVEALRVDAPDTTLSPGTRPGAAELIPSAVAVSIGVPSDYYDKVWRKHHSTSAGPPKMRPRREELARIETATLAKIEEIVTALVTQIPLADGKTADVTVQTDEVLPVEIPAVRTIGDRLNEWLLKHWQAVALVLGGVFVLLYLRRSIRVTNEPTSPANSQEDEATARPTVAHYGHEHDSESEPRDPAELQEELSDLIREDPNAAAEALKKFLGKVA